MYILIMLFLILIIITLDINTREPKRKVKILHCDSCGKPNISGLCFNCEFAKEFAKEKEKNGGNIYCYNCEKELMKPKDAKNLLFRWCYDRYYEYTGKCVKRKKYYCLSCARWHRIPLKPPSRKKLNILISCCMFICLIYGIYFYLFNHSLIPSISELTGFIFSAFASL